MSNPSIPPKSGHLSSDHLIIIVVTSIFALAAVIVILLVIRRLRHTKGGTPVYDAEKFAAWREEKFTPRPDEDLPRLQRLRSISCPQQPSLSHKLSLYVLRRPPLPASADDAGSDAQSSVRVPSICTDISRFKSTILVVHHVPKDREITITTSRDILLQELKDLILKSFENEDCLDQPIEIHRVADRIEGVSLISTDEQLYAFLETFKYSTKTHVYLYYPRPPPPAVEDIVSSPTTTQESVEVDLAEPTIAKDVSPKNAPTPLRIEPSRSRCISGPCGSWIEVNSVAPSAAVRSQTSPGEGRWW